MVNLIHAFGSKYDGDGNNLAGAVIEFSCIGGPGATYDEFSNVTATGTSGWSRTGTASRQFTTTTEQVFIDHLAPNSTYRFHEVSAPDATYILSKYLQQMQMEMLVLEW